MIKEFYYHIINKLISTFENFKNMEPINYYSKDEDNIFVNNYHIVYINITYLNLWSFIYMKHLYNKYMIIYIKVHIIEEGNIISSKIIIVDSLKFYKNINDIVKTIMNINIAKIVFENEEFNSLSDNSWVTFYEIQFTALSSSLTLKSIENIEIIDMQIVEEKSGSYKLTFNNLDTSSYIKGY